MGSTSTSQNGFGVPLGHGPAIASEAQVVATPLRRGRFVFRLEYWSGRVTRQVGALSWIWLWRFGDLTPFLQRVCLETPTPAHQSKPSVKLREALGSKLVSWSFVLLLRAAKFVLCLLPSSFHLVIIFVLTLSLKAKQMYTGPLGGFLRNMFEPN